MSGTDSRQSRKRKPKNKGAYFLAHTYATSWLIGRGLRLSPATTKPVTLAKLLGVYMGDNKHSAMHAVLAWYRNVKGDIPQAKITQTAQQFYSSMAWRDVRYKALRASNGRCALCGTPGAETQLHVDHIQPRSLFPYLALELSNLQVLCKECNAGKSNHDCVDWRDNTDVSAADREIGKMLDRLV